jgi:hypothetical protein
MKRLLALALALLPMSALAQTVGTPQSLPLVVDLKKAELGSWAEYAMTFGEIKMKSRWALVARDAKSTTLEMAMEGAMMAQMGGKITMKMVLDPDPIGAAKPVKEMVVQMGNGDPVLAPPDAPAQKFQKPDARTLVGKEEIQVPAGSFKTAHYRDHTQMGTVDVWVNEEIPPLGIVKVLTTPEPAAGGDKQMAIPPATMELTATGSGAKPTITKKAKPFDAGKVKGAGKPASRPGKKAK